MKQTILLLFVAYLLGSIPAGLWIGKVFFHLNLMEHGSGNTGTTNTFRVLGKRAGMVVFAIDFLKGVIATLIPLMFQSEATPALLCGLAAVLGHTFSIFMRFKGGKAVATSAGVVLALAPSFFLYVIVLFALTLYLTSMISFSSVFTATWAIIGVLIFPILGIIRTHYDFFTLLIVALASLIILRHKENIQRILRKEESLVPWGLNLTKQKKKLR